MGVQDEKNILLGGEIQGILLLDVVSRGQWLDPAFFSIVTERYKVLHAAGDGEGHHGNSWALSGTCDAGWLLACIACPSVETGWWPGATASG